MHRSKRHRLLNRDGKAMGAWSTVAPFALHYCSHGIDLPLPAILQMCRYVRANKENKGGTYDNCWASFSIYRRIVLSLGCRDCIGLFC